MTKDAFLTIIQSEAHIEGSNAAMVWGHAQSISESDKVWQALESESHGPDELVWQYCRFFGLQYVKPASCRQCTQVERWTKKIAQTESYRSSVAPEKLPAFEANLEELKAKLAYAIKYDL